IGKHFMPGTFVLIGRHRVRPRAIAPRRIVFVVPPMRRPGPRPLRLVRGPRQFPAGQLYVMVGGRPVVPAKIVRPGHPRPMPTRVTGMTPPRARTGTTVTVMGVNFRPGTMVQVGPRRFAPTSLTPTRITFLAPGGKPGPQPVYLVHGRWTAPVGKLFVIAHAAGPAVTRVVPRRANHGSLITVLGAGFRPGIMVQVGRRPVRPTSIAPNRLTFILPRTPPGTIPLYLRRGPRTIPMGNILVVVPRVTNVSPRRVRPGDVVTVSGTGFSSAMFAQVAHRRVAAQSATATTLTFVVPHMRPGPKPLSLFGGARPLAAGNIVVMPRHIAVRITAVEPKRPTPGTLVSIFGVGFPDDARVQLGRHVLIPQSADSSHVSFIVPQGKMGPRPLTLLARGQRISAGALHVHGGRPVVAIAPPPPRHHGGDSHDRPSGAHPGGVGGAQPTPAGNIEERRKRWRDEQRKRRERWDAYRRLRPIVYRFSQTGDRIVIYGRNFLPTAQVLINKTPVTAARITPRRIVFTMPPTTGRTVILLTQPSLRRPLFVGLPEPVAPQIDQAALARARAAEERRRRAEDARRIAEARRAAQARWRARQAMLAKIARSRADRQARYQAEWEALKARREARRRARLAALRAQWKAKILRNEQVRAELALHARRKARLNQMQRIAEVENLQKLAIRVSLALSRENRRHARRMRELQQALSVQGI
ncbi:MAG: IPT/TIG domain-containing protein, partial [Myxococcales bacterium]|nr:IPT/TIG domain-containing protein [Myxococcales bacterium]